MLSINGNVSALDAQNNLNSVQEDLQKTVSELSSGLQIQTAADNASGYVISQYLQVQSNGSQAAISNAQNATGMLQIAQGSMNQEMQILQQMNTLATESANGTNDASSLAANQAQFAALQSQLTQIASTTQYGQVNLLGGTSTAGTFVANGSQTVTFQVGAYSQTANQISVTLHAVDATSLGVGVGSASIGTQASALAAMSSVQAAISTLATDASNLGATQNQLQAIVNNLTVAQENVYAAHSRLVNVDVAQASSQFTSDQVLAQAGVSVLAQAQSLPQLALKLI